MDYVIVIFEGNGRNKRASIIKSPCKLTIQLSDLV